MQHGISLSFGQELWLNCVQIIKQNVVVLYEMMMLFLIDDVIISFRMYMV